MNILLIETEHSGHHISLYLNSIVDKLISKNHKITILTNKKVKYFPSFSYLRKKNIKILYLRNYKVFNRSNYLSILLNQIILYFRIKEKLNNNYKFDYIYFNTLSVIDKALSLFGSPFKQTKFSGLMPSINFHKSSKLNEFFFYKSFINKILFKKCLTIKNLEKIFVPDIEFLKYANKNLNPKKKVCISYDFGFFDEKINSSKSKKIVPKKIVKQFKNNKTYILIYGSIRYEKGLHYLLKAFSLINKNHNINLIIAGKQDKFTKNYINYYKKLDNLKNKLLIYDHFISKNFEDYLFKKSSYIWTGYTKNYHGSSAVFFLSSKYFKPVITSNHGLINYYNKKFKIGFSCKINNIGDILKLLRFIQNKPRKISKKNFFLANKNHNQKKFSDNIYNNIFVNN